MAEETNYLQAILSLMRRDKLPMHMKIGDEERLSIEFADLMRVETLEGRYKGIWGHIPNEGKRHPLVAMLVKAMGLIPGSTDYYFIWNGGGMVIELKLPCVFA